jgi:hypothetical protein
MFGELLAKVGPEETEKLLMTLRMTALKRGEKVGLERGEENNGSLPKPGQPTIGTSMEEEVSRPGFPLSKPNCCSHTSMFRHTPPCYRWQNNRWRC